MFKPISGLFGQVHVLEKWPNMIKLNYFRGGYLLNTNQNYDKVDIQWLHMGIAQMWEFKSCHS